MAMVGMGMFKTGGGLYIVIVEVFFTCMCTCIGIWVMNEDGSIKGMAMVNMHLVPGHKVCHLGGDLLLQALR